ncbi:MAG: hypothetical protein HY553_19415 [Elusimicrobia bacterium]|nr:hypothetical protein [Elusimicrobiota bacterium]
MPPKALRPEVKEPPRDATPLWKLKQPPSRKGQARSPERPGGVSDKDAHTFDDGSEHVAPLLNKHDGTHSSKDLWEKKPKGPRLGPPSPDCTARQGTLDAEEAQTGFGRRLHARVERCRAFTAYRNAYEGKNVSLRCPQASAKEIGFRQGAQGTLEPGDAHLFETCYERDSKFRAEFDAGKLQGLASACNADTGRADGYNDKARGTRSDRVERCFDGFEAYRNAYLAGKSEGSQAKAANESVFRPAPAKPRNQVEAKEFINLIENTGKGIADVLKEQEKEKSQGRCPEGYHLAPEPGEPYQGRTRMCCIMDGSETRTRIGSCQ